MDTLETSLPSAFDSVSVDEIRSMENPNGYTVYLDEVEERMGKEGGLAGNDRQEEIKNGITLAALWRISDGNTGQLEDAKAKGFLEKFYSFANEEKNKQLIDTVMTSLMTGIWSKEIDHDWGLVAMSEIMENFILSYLGKRLFETRTDEDQAKHIRLSKVISDVIERQEAQVEVDEGTEDIDDLIESGFGGEYRLSDKMVEGFRKLLNEDDKKAAHEGFLEDIKKAEETLGNQ